MTLLQVAITMQTCGDALNLLSRESRHCADHVIVYRVHAIYLLQSLLLGAYSGGSRQLHLLPVPAVLHLRYLTVRNWRALLRLLIILVRHILCLLYLRLINFLHFVHTLTILLLHLSHILLSQTRLHLLLELGLRHEPLELF